MKKLYFLSAVVFSAAFINAQVLEGDNFNSYTLGDVGTDTTGATPGQGDIYTVYGTNADFQIANIDATHGKSFTLRTGATAVGSESSRIAAKLGLNDAWLTRTSGNNILQVAFEIYTGNSAGNTRIGSSMYTASSAIAGIYYNTQTKTISGQANLTSDADGSSGFYNISGLTANTYPANTWIKVGYAYDGAKGTLTYIIDGVKSNLSIGGYSITKGLEPVENDFVAGVLAGNTASFTGGLDNYTTQAVNNTDLATINVGSISGVDVSFFPNPTSDFLNFTGKVTAVQIFDAAGKSVLTSKSVQKQVDVRNLAKGVYIIKYETTGGTQTSKFIKK